MDSPRMLSPRTGSASAPVPLPGSAGIMPRSSRNSGFLMGQLSSSSLGHHSPSSQMDPSEMSISRRRRSHSGDQTMRNPPGSPNRVSRKSLTRVSKAVAKAQTRGARKLNDSLVYLDGPQIYTCGHCRTHLTSHDEIISKSFHGRHGRAYLFDSCVNVGVGPPEDRLLITGLHSVCDIFCKRCKHMVGWTYAKAYETSQKYKEGKFIIEKINLHLEESDYYQIAPPAGERKDRFRARSISWGSDSSMQNKCETVFEYQPSPSSSSSYHTKGMRTRGKSCIDDEATVPTD